MRISEISPTRAAILAGVLTATGLAADATHGQNNQEETASPPAITENQSTVPSVLNVDSTITTPAQISPETSIHGFGDAKPNEFELLNQVVTQPKSDIRTDITLPQVRRNINEFLRNHSDEIGTEAEYVKPGDPHHPYTKREIRDSLKFVGKAGYWARYQVGRLVYALGRIAGDPNYSQELRAKAAKRVDFAYDGLVGQNPDSRNAINASIKGNIQDQLHPR